VFWVEAFDGRGEALRSTRPNPYEWDIAGHDGTVRLLYRVFGDLVDGTYLAVDTTHAHMNMPATFMFDLDRQDHPMRATFTPPAGSHWKVATQLYPTADPFTFTAPNLQYFMDSPTELSDFVLSTFTVPNADGKATFRSHTPTPRKPTSMPSPAWCSGWFGNRGSAGEFPQHGRATTRSCSTTGRRMTATGWSTGTARSSHSRWTRLKTAAGRRPR
jgi:hypothetical protein